MASESGASAADPPSVSQELNPGVGRVEGSTEHDLTVIGATGEGVLQRFLFGATPDTVGEPARDTVITARRDLEVRPRLGQSVDRSRKRITGTSSAMPRGELG